jgi:hypothetical protein
MEKIANPWVYSFSLFAFAPSEEVKRSISKYIQGDHFMQNITEKIGDNMIINILCIDIAFCKFIMTLMYTFFCEIIFLKYT